MWRTFRLFYFAQADKLGVHFCWRQRSLFLYNDAGATGDAVFLFLCS